MENIILSMLLIKDMTIYEMRMFIQQTLTAICSDSLGSLQVALKNLLAKNCISCTQRIENSVLKKEYSITYDGVMQFSDWIKTPMNNKKQKNMEQGKFFFLGMADHDTRIHALEQYIGSLSSELETTERLYELVQSAEGTAVQLNSEHLEQDKEKARQTLMLSGEHNLIQAVKHIYDYQIYQLEYEVRRLREDIAFYSLILEREKNKG